MFEQIKLPYDFADLEPYIDAATMEVHYTGHHATYTKALNDLVEKVPAIQGKTAEQILMDLDAMPDEFRIAIRNNCGGFYNHNLYFESLSPDGAREAKGSLRDRIKQDFGGFERLTAALKQAALGQFGSGYAWLVYCEREQKLAVRQSANQECPIADGRIKLLLPIDVWEHAYYLKYRNKRAAYLDALFQVIDWDVVSGRFGGV